MEYGIMNTSKVTQDIKNYLIQAGKKSPDLLAITFIYLVLLVFWRFNLNIIHPELILFFAGGLLGIYFLDLAEIVLQRTSFGSSVHSPFKNVLVQVILIPLTLFVVTSSGSYFGSGLVLSIFLTMIYKQWQEIKKAGNLDSWFWIIKAEFSKEDQRNYLLIISGVFSFLSLLF